MEYAEMDYSREKRCGIEEVIYGEGKTAEQITAIFEEFISNGIPRALATKVSEQKAEKIMTEIQGLTYYRVPGILIMGEDKAESREGNITVITAGTSDYKVAEEASIVCRYFGYGVNTIYDVGVSGIDRLLSRIDEIRMADVVIAVAGMEGALPTVVAGLIDKPLIGVPTSVGYGANLNGISAMLAMLNSCAPGIGVVNIDNGFGAAALAHKILGVRKQK